MRVVSSVHERQQLLHRLYESYLCPEAGILTKSLFYKLLTRWNSSLDPASKSSEFDIAVGRSESCVRSPLYNPCVSELAGPRGPHRP